VTDEIKHNPMCPFWGCFQIPRALSLSLSLPPPQPRISKIHNAWILIYCIYIHIKGHFYDVIYMCVCVLCIPLSPFFIALTFEIQPKR
jgi:hypothetical protein